MDKLKYNKEYYLNNKEKLNNQSIEYNKHNKNSISKNKKGYYEKNKEEIIKKRKEYYHKNKEKIQEQRRLYRKNNKGKIAKQEAESQRRYLSTPLGKLKHNIRAAIRRSLVESGYVKKYKSEEILGCNINIFKKYIESEFEKWMNWDNKGLYNGQPNYGWDLDHIIPLSSAKTEEEVIKLNHYTNIQPLCSYYNRDIKKNLII